jgi:hypothetical protein
MKNNMETPMTEFTEVPQEIKELPQETTEVSETRQAVDRATFEPEAAVERSADIKTAEAVEAAVIEAVEAVAAADGGQRTGDGVKAAVSAADGGPETEDGEDAAPAVTADGGPDIKSEDGQNQAQRLVQDKGDRTIDLGNVGTSSEDVQRVTEEGVVKIEGAPRPDAEGSPPPPETEGSGVAPSAPPESNAGEEDYTETFSDEQQMVQDQIADQTTAVPGAVQRLESAGDAVEQAAQTLDESTGDQPGTENPGKAASSFREQTAEELSQQISTADRGNFSSSLSAAQKISTGSDNSELMDTLEELVGPVTGSVVIGQESQQLGGPADLDNDALLSQFTKLNAVSPAEAVEELPLDGAAVQEAVEGDDSAAELLMNYRDTLDVLQSDLESLQQFLEQIQNAPEGANPPEVSTVHLPVKNSDGSYQLIEMPVPLSEVSILSVMANLQGQIIKITTEIELLED